MSVVGGKCTLQSGAAVERGPQDALESTVQGGSIGEGDGGNRRNGTSPGRDQLLPPPHSPVLVPPHPSPTGVK